MVSEQKQKLELGLNKGTAEKFQEGLRGSEEARKMDCDKFGCNGGTAMQKSWKHF